MYRACKSAFTTSAILAARNRRPPSPQSSTIIQISSDSKLEPAQTVASHTEGILEETEDLTWRDFDPVGGMPLPDGELSQRQINGIFGNEDMDVNTGNYILSVMYWRRMSGALIDSALDFPKDSGVSRDQALRGLHHVRTLDPDFDEKAAAQMWAEEESQRLQEELQERAVKLRLYKRDEADAEPEPVLEATPEEDQGTAHGRDRNRDSALQRMREEKDAQFDQEETDKQAAEGKAELAALHSHRGPLELEGGVQPSVQLQTYTGPDGISISQPQRKAWLQPIQRKPWVKYYEDHAMIIKTNEVPQMSVLRRLAPSFLMLLATLAFCLYLSDNYTPPPKSARIWPDWPPAVATLTALTGTLALFFLAGRLPPLWRTYSKYFTLVPAYPYASALVGATFRHDTLSHLLTNTASLWLFGLLLHEDVGRGTFLAIFLGSGAVGSFISLTSNVLRKQWLAYVFGSSGCVLGVAAAACVLRPTGTIRVWGADVPIAAWVFLAFYGLGEVVAAVRMRKSAIDHVGHLGGIVAGMAAGVWLRVKYRRQREDSEGVVARTSLPESEGDGVVEMKEAALPQTNTVS